MDILVNIDVPDLAAGEAFYTQGLGLRPGRRFKGFVELLGASSRVYLLEERSGSVAAESVVRRYDRHWTPVHLDVVVDDFDAALARVKAAGGQQEAGPRAAAYGRIVSMADPFGNGFCLIQFNERDYDAITIDG